MNSGTQTDPAFERLFAYVRANRGFEFTRYEGTELARRTRKRMQMLGVDTYEAYLDHLESNPAEFVELFDAILPEVTGFFRDREAWRHVETEIVPRILSGKPGPAPVRVWCPGCASGEEAYTAAMVFAQALGVGSKAPLKVYATDADDDALSRARRVSFTAEEVANVPEPYRDAYFRRNGIGYAFDPDLRRSIIFGRHDLVRDAPISDVDLLVCRNRLPYFNARKQDRVLRNFELALNDEGYLFLGESDVLLARAHAFTPVDPERRIFRRAARGERGGIRALGPGDEHAAEPGELQAAGFEAAAAAQLVADRNGTLRLANVRARRLFGLAPTDVGRPIQDLDVLYGSAELSSMLHESYERGRVTTRELAWKTESGPRVFEVHVTPLATQGGEVLGVGLTCFDVTRHSLLRDELQRSKAALEEAYEKLQSSNEELETTSEELQSTNRQLETINEHLQSTNEELEAISGDLRAKTTELSRVNSFLETILSGLDAAVVVLDENFHVLAWNATAEEMWGLKFDEVRGRSLLGLDVRLPVGELRATITSCLGGKGGSNVVLDAANRRGRQIRCRVQCKPLSGVAGNPTGVLLLLEELPAGEELQAH